MMRVVRERRCKEVSDVTSTCNVGDCELAESHAVSDPIQVHIGALGFLDFEFAVGKANGALIVSEDGGGGLGVAEIK